MHKKRSGAGNLQNLAIANCNFLFTMITWMHKQVVRIISDMICGPWINIPGRIWGLIEGGSRSKLSRWIFALEGVVHPMTVI